MPTVRWPVSIDSVGHPENNDTNYVMIDRTSCPPFLNVWKTYHFKLLLNGLPDFHEDWLQSSRATHEKEEVIRRILINRTVSNGASTNSTNNVQNWTWGCISKTLWGIVMKLCLCRHYYALRLPAAFLCTAPYWSFLCTAPYWKKKAILAYTSWTLSCMITSILRFDPSGFRTAPHTGQILSSSYFFF